MNDLNYYIKKAETEKLKELKPVIKSSPAEIKQPLEKSPKNNNGKKITKKIITELQKIASNDVIEAGIVKKFLKDKGIVNVKNKLVNELISVDCEDVIHFLMRSNLNLNLEDVEKFFELLIPKEDKQVNGAVYTPSFIVNYIVQETILTKGTVCDPSCGSGAFLIGSLKHLMSLTQETPTNIIEKYLFGVDILEYAIRRSKIILSLYAISFNDDKEDIKFNLFTKDSLTTNWNELFPNIFENGGFDFIVSNPPYVRIQDLTKDLKERLLSTWNTVGNGNFNIYFAFFELGNNILKDSGKLGYITPNNYFTSLAGAPLRKYFTKESNIRRILDFNHLKIFDHASTYTCVTFIDKDYKNDHFEYFYLEDPALLSNLTSIKYSDYNFEWLNDRKWRLMTGEEYEIVQKMETNGVPLGEFAKIRVGIATLKDTIYFVEDNGTEECRATYNNKIFYVEKEITKKVVKIPTITNEESIVSDSRRIIFPYERINGKWVLLDEHKLKNKHPKCYEYLSFTKEELETRDKGKKSYPAWFAWGRTQGMDFRGQRIYTRTFYNKPDFMLDKGEDNLFCNGYAVFYDGNIEALQAILNSKVMAYYMKKTSVEIEGNYQCYQKNFIEKFCIPKLTESEWDSIINLDENKLIELLSSKYGFDPEVIHNEMVLHN